MPKGYITIPSFRNRTRVRLWAGLAAAGLVLLGLIGSGDRGGPEFYNLDGGFDLAEYDSGNHEGECFIQAPWGPRSWTIEGSSFSDPSDHSLSACRFAVHDGRAYLYGRNRSHQSKWGFVRYSQGRAENASNCGPIPGHNPEPLSVLDRHLTLNIDVYRDTSRLLKRYGGWIMFAVNVWLKAEPEPGRPDLKPVVLDLILHHQNTYGRPPVSFESEYAYHYQANVGETPEKAWQFFRIDLSRHLQAALNHAWPSGFLTKEIGRFKIQQLDFVIELVNAEGAATIDNFYLAAEQY